MNHGTVQRMTIGRVLAVSAAVVCFGSGDTRAQPGGNEPPLNVLAPENLARERPEPPFDLTGTWQHEFTGGDSWRFLPEEFELTEWAQEHYEAGRAAQAEGRLYRDDIGQCWPAGMPLIMTRVWPIDMIQLPTAVYMISHFMNSVRIVYMDGREHSHPDLVVPSWNGESVGWWEDDELVIDTKYFPGHHHWIDQGGAAIPASDELHIVERVRMIDDGERLEIEYTLTDPKSWKGEWTITKYFGRVRDVDLIEAGCLPDLNENLPATSSESLVR